MTIRQNDHSDGDFQQSQSRRKTGCFNSTLQLLQIVLSICRRDALKQIVVRPADQTFTFIF